MTLRCFVAGLLALALVPTAVAQPRGLQPAVFAIRGARVVTEPGQVLPKANVVIRNGVITAVAADAAVPPDALVVDGQGLTVYPGFIDALSNWGYDPSLRRSQGGPPAVEDLASESLATTKADNRKGVTPEFQVATALKADPETAEAWRKLGFTAHLVAPDGGLFVGQSAAVSISEAPPRDAVLRSPVALHAAFRVSGGDYPRSLMGIFAHARQTLLDADYNRQLWTLFEKNGRAGRQPPLDPALSELARVLGGQLPVVIEADTRDGIDRVLDFAEEFKLRPILFGGRDAWKVAERLKQAKVPVILRLNYSEPGGSEGEQTVPRRALEDRRAHFKEQLHNAAELARHGVPFAFSNQALDKPEKFRDQLRKVMTEGLSPDAALRALTLDAARILGVEKQVGTVAPGRLAHLIVTDGDFQEPKTQVCYVFVDGVRYEYAKPNLKPAEPARAAAPEKPKPAEPARGEQATETDSDRKPRVHTGGNVFIRGATVLTVSNGTQPRCDILVRDGKIAQVGPGLKPPDGMPIIDAEGMFVMPGIIDTHSHFAISGGVNEFSLSVVPEVRVRDVIDSEDVEIYRALAGGVTTARLLHGSANVVGGQDAVIKLKYGEPAKKLLLADAPRGVKFALGENVKRTDGRFPNSRLGVEAVLIRAFSEAQAYQRLKESGQPFRRDLRLEALADVLKGDLKVHCHCYRSDEILMLLRLAERFGFKVKSLQHVLEGYKIAPEIADHGASCSTFSDWWAYKIEAYDAIPHNSALLNEAGATVCLKSDSNELMRHLYQEAAKCMKYGGMSETDALKTITLNGAKQLGLDKRLGSIEVGKDADLAIFNGHPLNSFARVEMTLVDGEVYFQRPTGSVSDRTLADQDKPVKLTAHSAAGAGPTPAAKELRPIPRNPEGQYVLDHVTIHPVSGPIINDGRVVIKDGRIVSAGSVKDAAPISSRYSLDGSGLHVYPGMIDAGTVLGLTELGSARETHDFAEGGDFQPDLRASVGINPDSELIPVTRANGVTTVVTRPIGSVVAGQSALINLAGWVPKEMALVDPLALQIEFPAAAPLYSADPTMPQIGRATARKQREEKIRRLKELFQQALAYDDAIKQVKTTPINPRLEALVPYARGQKPVIIQANRKPEIVEALKLADDLKLKVILSGAIDAWKVADELKKRDVPVIVGPVMTLPQDSYDPYDAPYACPARLHEAGIRFCIRSTGGSNTRNLPYEAAMAVSYGLPPEEGLKAVTLYPAQILGVADQLGTIETSKRANLVLTDGDILQASTHVLAVFIDGKPLEPASKQTRLYERYRERLREVKEGRAPLGTK